MLGGQLKSVRRTMSCGTLASENPEQTDEVAVTA